MTKLNGFDISHITAAFDRCNTFRREFYDCYAYSDGSLRSQHPSYESDRTHMVRLGELLETLVSEVPCAKTRATLAALYLDDPYDLAEATAPAFRRHFTTETVGLGSSYDRALELLPRRVSVGKDVVCKATRRPAVRLSNQYDALKWDHPWMTGRSRSWKKHRPTQYRPV